MTKTTKVVLYKKIHKVTVKTTEFFNLNNLVQRFFNKNKK